MVISNFILGTLGGLFVGLLIGLVGRRIYSRKQLSAAQKKAEEIIETAKKNAKSLKKEAELEAKDIQLKAKIDG